MTERAGNVKELHFLRGRGRRSIMPRMASLDEAREAMARRPGDAMTRMQLSIELYNVLSDAQDEEDLARRDALLQELRNLAAAHPDDPSVRKRLAKGFWIVLMHAHEKEDASGRDAALAELRGLGARCESDNHVQKYVIRANNIFRA